MPTETELRAWLHDGHGAALPAIDPVAVLRRSRRRRLPKQLAVGGTLTLAIAGIGVAGVTGLRSLAPGGAAMSASDSSSDAAPESIEGGAEPGFVGGTVQQAPANKINLCGGALTQPVPRSTGLVMTVQFPATAALNGQDVEGSVTVTNTGTERATGTTAASPAITVSQDGLVLWHSNGPMIMLAALVDLGPGESMEYGASFTPVRCDVEDDLGESFRDDLPALPPGDYQVSAAIDFVPDGASPGVPSEQIISPAAPITLTAS